MKVPDCLTRHYVRGEDPFLSLNDLPIEEANRAKMAASDKYGWGGFYAQEDYLTHRRVIEQWMRATFIQRGGAPRDTVPVYFFLGDVRGGYRKFGEDTAILRIPLGALDSRTISFTWPDSMYAAERDASGFTGVCRRTNTPQVYMRHELDDVMTDVEAYNALPGRQSPPAVVEAQVWDREGLYAWYRGQRG